MAKRVEVATVHLWGNRIAAVAWDEDAEVANFEYYAEFVDKGLEVAPFKMPLREGLFRFPELPRASFHGLPGLIADSIPDRFGSTLIDEWLRSQGRERTSFTPVEQLCYIGRRGMGALEYEPALAWAGSAENLDVNELADLAARVLSERDGLTAELDEDGLTELLRVGTSAGGARAKAVIAWNETTGEIRAGQLDAPEGFEYWLLKFDGVGSDGRGLTDPEGYGRIEYAYYMMALDAGLEMMPARIEEDPSGRAHFMTKRFDRKDGAKLHMQSLAALQHLDFNQIGAASYEDAFSTTQGLGIPPVGVHQMFRRMVFNVVARNNDDHPKNIAYLMSPGGAWDIAPAFDVIWAYNPDGQWTNRHQMSINGKRDDFTRADLVAVGRRYGIRAAGSVIDEVIDTVSGWDDYAEKAGVLEQHSQQIRKSHRLRLD